MLIGVITASLTCAYGLFAWCLCRVSALADRDAANAWMDCVIEKPADLYPPTMTQAEADEVFRATWR